LALQEWASHKFPLRHLVPSDIADELERRFNSALCNAHVGTVFSQVQKECKKYKSLKTEKAKNSSIEKMKSIIRSSLSNQYIDSSKLIAMLDDIGVEIELLNLENTQSE
jgi:hypothetical protein